MTAALLCPTNPFWMGPFAAGVVIGALVAVCMLVRGGWTR